MDTPPTTVASRSRSASAYGVSASPTCCASSLVGTRTSASGSSAARAARPSGRASPGRRRASCRNLCGPGPGRPVPRARSAAPPPGWGRAQSHRAHRAPAEPRPAAPAARRRQPWAPPKWRPPPRTHRPAAGHRHVLIRSQRAFLRRDRTEEGAAGTRPPARDTERRPTQRRCKRVTLAWGTPHGPVESGPALGLVDARRRFEQPAPRGATGALPASTPSPAPGTEVRTNFASPLAISIIFAGQREAGPCTASRRRTCWCRTRRRNWASSRPREKGA